MTKALNHDIAVRLLDVLDREVTSIKAHLAKRLHARHLERGGSRKDVGSTKVVVIDRAYRAVRDGIGLTFQQAEELLDLLGFAGPDAVDQFIARHMARDEAGLLATLHARLAASETAALAYRDQKEAEYSDARVFGSVIELRRLRNPGSDHWRWGIPIEQVTLIDTGYPMAAADALRVRSLHVPPPNWPKYTLSKVEPADTDDANAGRLSLKVDRTDYVTVKQCDPSIYDDYGGAPTFVADGTTHNNVTRLANRLRYGSLEPGRSQIPYCLTLFVVILLSDGKVLFMRRSAHVGWFPNTIEFSGGEQLREDDFADAAPFKHWVHRAIKEEFLPTSHLDKGRAEDLHRRFYGKAFLSGIGFDTTTCSFPLFCLYESRCNEAEYLALFDEARRLRSATNTDREGTLCIVNQTELKKLLSEGHVLGRAISTTSRGSGFVLETRDKPAAFVRLDATDLHPMTAYRLALLVDVLDVQR